MDIDRRSVVPPIIPHLSKVILNVRLAHSQMSHSSFRVFGASDQSFRQHLPRDLSMSSSMSSLGGAAGGSSPHQFLWWNMVTFFQCKLWSLHAGKTCRALPQSHQIQGPCCFNKHCPTISALSSFSQLKPGDCEDAVHLCTVVSDGTIPKR